MKERLVETPRIRAFMCPGAWNMNSRAREGILNSLYKSLRRPCTKRELECDYLSEDGFCLQEQRRSFPLKAIIYTFAMFEDIAVTMTYISNPRLAPPTTLDELRRGKRCPFVDA